MRPAARIARRTRASRRARCCRIRRRAPRSGASAHRRRPGPSSRSSTQPPRSSGSTRSRSAGATSRPKVRRSFRATRRPTATGTARSAARPRAIGWHEPLPKLHGPRHLARAQELVNRVGVVRARAPALRRQRVGPVRHVRHGPGRAHRPRRRSLRRNWASARIASLIVMGDTSVVPVRFVHVGEPFDGVHGQRHRQGVPGHQVDNSERWRPTRSPSARTRSPMSSRARAASAAAS